VTIQYTRRVNRESGQYANIERTMEDDRIERPADPKAHLHWHTHGAECRHPHWHTHLAGDKHPHSTLA
jgi:hypothetical protein